MSVDRPVPEPSGTERRIHARARRLAATELAFNRHHSPALAHGGRTAINGEEAEYTDTYCTSFTKGLQHNSYGILDNPTHYELFVEGINRPSDTYDVAAGKSWFEEKVQTADPALFQCTDSGGATPNWRGWESPRSGHTYDLEGPDAETLCMAPAPLLSSAELHVEVAEVYALALLRDVPLTDISNGTGSSGTITVNDIQTALSSMDWFTGTPPSETLESKRRMARGIIPLATQNLFRGSAPGVKDGPYISQFLLVGGEGRAGPKVSNTGTTNPGSNARFEPDDGYIVYGTQIIDQRNFVHLPNVDYMTQWDAWLDVQNGANLKDTDLFLDRRRFISTPRDLATFVHFDQLYQAYFNAALLLGGMPGIDTDPGFPSGKRHAYPSAPIKRDSFATFGGPHLLALLTEVSSRALRAVRRQKFNYHRRARPEVMGWIASLAASTECEQLGHAKVHAEALLNGIPANIKDAIKAHNTNQNTNAIDQLRKFRCTNPEPAWLQGNNLLLPMAFPEGSPMHPAYGAGHATVAGACVTILKAFFRLRNNAGAPISYTNNDIYVSDTTDTAATANIDTWGTILRALQASEIIFENPAHTALTVEGELNKLAANIAIGRNMAGVHYYTDYYDSLRLGERVAAGILHEQMTNYPDAVSMTFWDFDNNKIEIKSTGDASAIVLVEDAPATDAWWHCSPPPSSQTPLAYT